MERTKVIFGLFAQRVDGGMGEERRSRWRPILELCKFDDFPVQTLHLFYIHEQRTEVQLLAADINERHPHIEVETLTGETSLEDFEAFYLSIYQYFNTYIFNLDRHDYYLYLPPGVYPQVTLALMDILRTLRLPLAIVQVYQYAEHGALKSNYSIFSIELSSALHRQQYVQEQHLSDQDFLKGGIATRNSRFNTLISRLEHVAVHSRAPVLLSGPTGAGKSLLVRRLYEIKRRHGQLSGPLVEVNCSTLRGDMAAAALFGHVRGAFTGAAGKRNGLLLTANNGMLFLDEVGELGLEEQALLLKAVEEQRFLPMGSDAEAHSHFLLVCGTNQNLPEATRTGRFRSDLLARINQWHFRLPALRERREDIAPNIRYELHRLSREHHRGFRFTPQAMERFLAFAISDEALWPGNFRELATTLERMVTFSVCGDMDIALVEEEIALLRETWAELLPPVEQTSARPQGCERTTSPDDAGQPATSAVGAACFNLRELLGAEAFEALDLFERYHLEGVVQTCRESGSLSDAGRRLFAVSRTRKRNSDDASRLYNYLKKYGLDWKAVRGLTAPPNANNFHSYGK